MSADGDKARSELALQLATGFAAMVMDYLPIIEEGVRRSSQRISFSARVEVWRNKDALIQGRLSSSPPKIPAPARPRVDFVLQMDRGGQLELVFEGTPQQMRKQIKGG